MVLWTEGIEDLQYRPRFFGNCSHSPFKRVRFTIELHLAYEGFLALQNDPLTLGP